MVSGLTVSSCAPGTPPFPHMGLPPWRHSGKSLREGGREDKLKYFLKGLDLGMGQWIFCQSSPSNYCHLSPCLRKKDKRKAGQVMCSLPSVRGAEGRMSKY